MNWPQNFLNVQFDDGHNFPPNVENEAEHQTQHQNTQYRANNQIYPPQVEYQQVYQPNIGYPLNQETNQSNTEYETNFQFYPPIADLNLEQQQTQQENTQYRANNQIYPPQVEYQQVYQPNIRYPVDQQINQSNIKYQTNSQFYPPIADFNFEQHQTQQENTQYRANNQIYPPRVEYQQVYQPNIRYPVDQQINQSNTKYQSNSQFYLPIADFNIKQQQTQQENTQYRANNQIYPPQVECQQVYQPNIRYPVDQQINQSSTKYQTNSQFYPPIADLNMENCFSALLPQKENRKQNNPNQIHPPQVEYQQVYQPNIINQTNQSNTEYQTDYQFNPPIADLNLEKPLSTLLPPPKETRKQNRLHTDEQIKYLEEQFKKNQYTTQEELKAYAAALGMEKKQIKRWYEGKRAKERKKLKANCQEANENQPLPNQSIGNVRDDGHRITLNSTNLFQYNYNNMCPASIRPEVDFNVNRTQNLGEPKEDNHIRDPQNPNNDYAYDKPNGYGNNLIQIPGDILPTPLGNIHPAPLQQNYQNILNNYYNGNNRNENLSQNLDSIGYPQFEGINTFLKKHEQN